MEQFFIILAVIVFWIFRGAAGTRRRLPGQDPYDGESQGSGGSIDVVGTTRQRTVEAQGRAIDALRRWEEKQGLTAEGKSSTAEGSLTVPAASRTRVVRPANIAGRTTAERKRRQAYADIAQLLDSGKVAGSPPRGRPRFEVEERARPEPPMPEARPARETRRATAAEPAQARPTAKSESRPASQHAAKDKRRGAGGARASARSRLARLESLPFAARAIVYAEILGRPRSLS